MKRRNEELLTQVNGGGAAGVAAGNGVAGVAGGNGVAFEGMFFRQGTREVCTFGCTAVPGSEVLRHSGNQRIPAGNAGVR